MNAEGAIPCSTDVDKRCEDVIQAVEPMIAFFDNETIRHACFNSWAVDAYANPEEDYEV